MGARGRAAVRWCGGLRPAALASCVALGLVGVAAACGPPPAVKNGAYASNGVVLEDVTFDGKRLRVTVDDGAEGVHRFAFIGDGGKELHRARGREAVFEVPEGYLGYVRAVVVDRRGSKAWVQPVWASPGA